MSGSDAAVREFLAEHPEHVQGVRQASPDEVAEAGHDRPATSTTVMDTDTLIAFTDWAIRTRRGDVAKARRFRELLRRKFGR